MSFISWPGISVFTGVIVSPGVSLFGVIIAPTCQDLGALQIHTQWLIYFFNIFSKSIHKCIWPALFPQNIDNAMKHTQTLRQILPTGAWGPGYGPRLPGPRASGLWIFGVHVCYHILSIYSRNKVGWIIHGVELETESNKIIDFNALGPCDPYLASTHLGGKRTSTLLARQTQQKAMSHAPHRTHIIQGILLV